jgi:hypothetical protein
MKVSIQIEFDEHKEHVMSDWVNRLRDREEAEQRQREQKQELDFRRRDLIAKIGPQAWDKVISQVDSDTASLRSVFPDDPTKDIEFSRDDRGFCLERRHYPQVLLKARWIDEINGVGVTTSIKPSVESGLRNTKEEIRFSLTAENNIRMEFAGRSYIAPESLSEPLIMRVLSVQP